MFSPRRFSLLTLLLCLALVPPKVIAQPLPNEGELLVKQGTAALQKRDLKAAETAFEQSVQTLREQKENVERSKQIIDLHLRIGSICGQFAAYDLSERNGRRALQLALQAQNALKQAAAYKLIGDTLTRMGRFSEAQTALGTARSLYIENKKLLEIAQTDASLGYYYRRIARYDLAIVCYLAALPILEKETNKRFAADGYNGFGAVYSLIGQHRKAKQQFEKGLHLHEAEEKRIAELTDAQKFQLKQGLAYSHSNLGVECEALGELDESRKHHELALTLRKENGNIQDIGKSLANLAGLAMTQERYEEAITLQKEALTRYRERSQSDDMIARTLGELGKLFLRVSKPTEAKNSLDEALTLHRKFDNPQEIVATLISLAELSLQTNELPQAAKQVNEAIGLQDELLTQIADPSQVGALQQATGKLYSVAACVALKQNRSMDALLWIERGRAVGLARQATLSNDGLARYLTPEQNAELARLTGEFASASRTLQAAYNDPEPDDAAQRIAYRARVEQTKQNSTKAEEALIRFREKTFAENAALKQLRGGVPLTAKNLEALAKAHPDTLYLSWSVQEDKLLTFAFSQSKPLAVAESAVSSKRLAAMVTQWRKEIVNPRAADTGMRETQAAKQLYEWLIVPSEQRGLLDPKQIKRIVVCGEDALTELPFAALLDSKGQRLMARYALSSTVSLGMLTWKQTQPKPSASLLCIADPCGERGQVLARADFDKDFGALPNARLEGTAITKQFPGATLLVGAQAREETIRATMPKYALLHFATHGWIDPVDPFRSCLILAPPDKEGTGVLEARAVLELPLAAQLTVLSACETGRGETTQGEGILGLVWAFRAAGCPNVIASHWSVNDAATRLLMAAFYTKLQSGARIDDALCFAMQTMQKHPLYHDPFYWAGFQLYGMGDALPKSVLPARK